MRSFFEMQPSESAGAEYANHFSMWGVPPPELSAWVMGATLRGSVESRGGSNWALQPTVEEQLSLCEAFRRGFMMLNVVNGDASQTPPLVGAGDLPLSLGGRTFFQHGAADFPSCTSCGAQVPWAPKNQPAQNPAAPLKAEESDESVVSSSYRREDGSECVRVCSSVVASPQFVVRRTAYLDADDARRLGVYPATGSGQPLLVNVSTPGQAGEPDRIRSRSPKRNVPFRRADSDDL